MDGPVGLALQQVEIAQPAYAWVRPCGRIAELGFKDKTGALVVLAVPHEALSMLLMTLPRLIEISLQQRTGDASLRHVYPVGDWRIDAAAGEAALLLTLATPDGFTVSFHLPSGDAKRRRSATARRPRSEPRRRSGTDPSLPLLPAPWGPSPAPVVTGRCLL